MDKAYLVREVKSFLLVISVLVLVKLVTYLVNTNVFATNSLVY